MDYFNGKYLHTLDPKGRLLLPMEIRTRFNISKDDPLYMVANINDPPRLEIRTAAHWEAYCQKLLDRESGPQKLDMFRYVTTHHAKVMPDDQGRIVIPPWHRDKCELDSTVAVLNMAVYIEVWCEKHMETKYDDMVKAYKDISDFLF